MKKRLIPIALVMGAISANAQVGIGTATPNKSAELTVEASNRGLLIPNVALADTKDTKKITNGNVNSLLVFNTTTNNAITPGYYYWFVDKWERLTAGSDIPAIVVNNFENILKMEGDKVTNLIENIVLNTEGNVIYEGDKLYYINDNGDKVEINFGDIVQQYETVTVLGYDAATGALTYSNESGAAVTVDIKAAVKSFETVTSIAVDNTAGTISFKDEAGNTTVLNLGELVRGQETVTNLVRVQAGKYKYTNEAGTEQEISVFGDIVDVINNRTDVDLFNVLKQLIKVEQSLTSLIYNATTKELVYTDEVSATHNIDVEALVKDNQYITELQQGKNISVVRTANGNTISYTLEVPTATRDVAGVVKPGSGLDIDTDGNLTVNLETALNGKDLTGNEKIVVTDGLGAVLKATSLDINESKLSLENIGGTLNLTQIQKGNAGDILVVDASGNVVWSAKDAITTNKLELNGTDLVSTVNGVASTVSLVDKLSTEMLKNGAVTAEKLGADGVDAGKVPVVQADGTVVYQNISSSIVEGKALTSANELMTVSLEAGVVLKDVQLTINQDKFDLAQIGGELKIVQIEKGANETVLVTDADGTVKWVTKDSVVKANETITILVPNTNGTFTYYNEAQIGEDGNAKAGETGVTIDPKEVSVALNTTTNKYEFKNSAGDVIGEIDANAGAIAFDNSTNGFASNNVQSALEELKAKLDGTSDTLVDNNDGTYTHTTVAGDEVIIDANTTTVSVEKGVYTFLNGKGETITSIDTNAAAITYNDTTTNLNVTNVQGAIEKIVERIEAGAGVELVDNNNGTITLKSNDGTVLGTVDKSSLTDNTDGTYTFDNGNGTPVVIDTNAVALNFDNSTNGFASNNVQSALEELKAKLDGTSDTLVDNNDGTYTHTTVAGDEVIIDANTTTVSVEKGVYTFLNGKGETITSIDTNAAAITYNDTTTNLNVTNVQGAIEKIVERIEAGAGVELVDNNNGTITLKSNDGTVLGTVDKSSLTDNTDGTYTFDNGNGTPVVIDTNAAALNFDNSTNGFASNNVQSALEELKAKLDGTSDTLVDNNDGTYTHTTVAGDEVIIDANTTTVSVEKGVYTFLNGKGETITSIDTNAAAITYNDTTTNLNVTNVQGAIEKIVERIEAGAGVELVDNNNGTITLKSNDGTVLGTVDKSSLTDNTDGTYTFDNGNGTPVVIDTNAAALNFDNSTNGFASNNVQSALEELKAKLDGTSDTLVDNNDGTYTHTTVAGDEVIIDANTTTVSVEKGVYTFLNGKGETITSIDTNAAAITYNDTTTNLNVTNVQGAIEKIVERIEAGAGVELVDNNNGTITLKSNDGTVLGTVDKSSLTDNTDGTYTFDNGNGTPVVIDTNAAALNFDNSTNGFASNNVQSALEELKAKLDGTSDTLVDNNDGTYTHTTVAGDEVIIDANTTTVSVEKGVYTFLNGKGETITSIDTNAAAITYNDTTTNLNVTNVQGAIEKLVEKITTVEGTKGELSVAGGLTFTGTTNGTDKLLADAGIEIAKGGVTTEKLANEAVTTDKIEDKAVVADKIADKAVTAGKLDAGTTTSDAPRVGIADKDGNVTYQTLDSVVKANETVTVLVDNEDGTFTYYNETQIGVDGKPLPTATGFVIDANTTTVEVKEGVYTFKDGKGILTTIDTNAGAIIFNNENTTFTSVNVQDALVELLTKITDVQNTKGDLKVAGGLLTIDAGGKEALLHDATITLNLSNLNSIKEVQGTYAMTMEDVILLGNAQGGETVLTLPTPTPENKGKKYTIKKHDANEDNYVTVQGTIEGATELYTALPFSGWDLVSDGSKWQIVNKF